MRYTKNERKFNILTLASVGQTVTNLLTELLDWQSGLHYSADMCLAGEIHVTQSDETLCGQWKLTFERLYRRRESMFT